MKLPNNLVDYLSNSTNTLQAGLIITNLSNIIYSNVSYYNFLETYNNKEISSDIENIINEWSTNIQFNDSLFKMYVANTINIISNDTNKYTGQLIFPIFHNEKLAGIFICFRFHEGYVKTSVKPAMTTRHFVEIMSNDDYIFSKL